MPFSSALQSLRKEAKVTQEELAQNLGVSAQAVSKWENGSFPEGDLIPRIADYFHVSIDYLYGRAGKETGIEQRVVSALNALWESYRQSGADMEAANKAYIDKIYDIMWAFQISAWIETSDYYPRPEGTDENSRMASVYANNYGYSYMSPNRNKDFYLFLKEPENKEGFGGLLRQSDDVRNFFRFLSDKTNMELLGYLYRLKYGEYVRRETLIKALGVSGDQIDKSLEYLMSLEEGHGNHPIQSVSVVNDEGKAETAYGVNMNMGGLLFGLLEIADTYVHAPCGFKLQIMNRCKEWAEA